MTDSSPTFGERLEYLRDNKWSKFRRGLRRDDQERFDELWSAAENRVEAGDELNPHDVEPAVMMSILVEQQRRIDELEERMASLDF